MRYIIALMILTNVNVISFPQFKDQKEELNNKSCEDICNRDLAFGHSYYATLFKYNKHFICVCLVRKIREIKTERPISYSREFAGHAGRGRHG